MFAISTILSILKKAWPVALALVLAFLVWKIVDIVDDAKDAQIAAEAKADAAENRAVRWKNSVDKQNETIQQLAETLEQVEVEINIANENSKIRWKHTNNLIEKNKNSANNLLLQPPALTEEKAIQDAKVSLKETEGFSYINTEEEINHVDK